MSDGLTEHKVTAENDRERQARQVQERQQVSNNQADWDRYVDARIQRYLDARSADDTLPDALHEALGQILAEERRQWRRERALIEAEAAKTIAELRSTISELASEIRQKAAEAKPDLSPEALREALGQMLADERRQWQRERELIKSEAAKTLAELRATIAELSTEIRQKASEAKPDLSTEALREVVDQVFAGERQQWQRERDLLRSEAAKTLAEFRAQNVEWHEEFLGMLNTRHRQFADTIDMRLDEVDRKVGPAGPPGPPGKLPPVKRFESGRVYYEGDCVAADGGLYQARCDTGHGVNHPDWLCLARAGRDGRDGATPEICGTYDAKAVYKKLDIIALDGATFISKRDNPGIPGHGDGWQLMSQQGKRGKPGQPGECGPRGEKGDTGPPAVVPQLIGSRIGENYELILVFSDNSKQIIPLRPAFERYHYYESGQE